MKRVHALLLTLVATPVAAVYADAPPAPPEDVWTGKGQAGYIGTQGNTDSRAINAAIDMALLDGPWKHAAHLGALYNQSDSVTSANRWDAGWQSNYAVSPRLFTFGALRYAHDNFSGFKYQASASAGLGYKIIDTVATSFSGQLGIGYRKSELDDVAQTSSNDAVITAGLDFAQHFSATTTLTDKFTVESGSSDTLITNALALAVRMSDKLALSVGYALQDNTKPPEGKKKLDEVETVNLVYSF